MAGGLLAAALASLGLRGGWGQRRLESTALRGCVRSGCILCRRFAWSRHPPSILPPGSGGAGVAVGVFLFGDPALQRTGQGDQHPALKVEVTPDGRVPECGDYSGTGGHAQVGVELVMRTQRDLDEVKEFLATLAGAPSAMLAGTDVAARMACVRRPGMSRPVRAGRAAMTSSAISPPSCQTRSLVKSCMPGRYPPRRPARRHSIAAAHLPAAQRAAGCWEAAEGGCLGRRG